MKLLSKTFSLFFTASLLMSAAAARQAPTAEPQQKLVLQIFRHSGAEPVYQEVPGMEWSPIFKPVRAKNPVRLDAPVRAVRVVSRYEEEGARVSVSVLTGVRFHDGEVHVASFVAREGEEVFVGELERFGVEPFKLVVLRKGPASDVPPAVVNKTRSVEAVSAIDRANKWPAKIVARNLSGKGVIALGLKTMLDNRVMSSTEPHGEEGLPLIAPGATYERHLPPGRGVLTPGGFAPEQSETIVLAAAVFEDGTYEGDADIAARTLARRASSRVQLERTIPMLREALGAPDANAPEVLARLKAEVSALGINAEQSLVEDVLKRFDEPVPRGAETVRVAAEVNMHYFRKQLLEELAAFEQGRARPAKKPQQAFSQWLQTKLDAYGKWLARL